MAQNDINLTYETLFDITRREKMQEDLQKLDPNFFNDLIRYVREKSKDSPKETQNNLFSNNNQGNQRQLDNIRKLISELYSRRERKIINLAIIKSRTNSKLIDTSALLEEEKRFFNFILSILNHSKKNILLNLLQGNEIRPLDASVCFNMSTQNPTLSSKGEQQTQKSRQPVALKKENSWAEEDTEDGGQKGDGQTTADTGLSSDAGKNTDSHKSPSDTSTQDASGQDSASVGVQRKIKFLNPVPKFVGKELEVYGPYEKEQVASLPKEIADVLVHKGRAEEIKE